MKEEEDKGSFNCNEVWTSELLTENNAERSVTRADKPTKQIIYETRNSHGSAEMTLIFRI
jgi:hypothetical protein